MSDARYHPGAICTHCGGSGKRPIRETQRQPQPWPGLWLPQDDRPANSAGGFFDTCKWVSAWPMGVVFSIFLIAVGAILRYATNFDVRSVDVDEVGLILMIVGAVGFVLSLLYEVFWARERSRWYRYAGRGRDVPPGPDEPRY
jgi:hypothetical protein